MALTLTPEQQALLEAFDAAADAANEATAQIEPLRQTAEDAQTAYTEALPAAMELTQTAYEAAQAFIQSMFGGGSQPLVQRLRPKTPPKKQGAA